jgi:ABC-type antimicrobial peptide transport system ATPase subunit
MALTRQEIDALASATVSVLKNTLEMRDVQLTSPTQRLTELEPQHRARAHKQALSFTGTYSDTTSYVPGDAATRQGGLWICTAPTAGPFDYLCWQLAVKKGDAR